MVVSDGEKALGRNSPVCTAQVSSPLNFYFHCRGEETKGRGVILCRAVPGVSYNAGFWKGEGGVLAAGGNI